MLWPFFAERSRMLWPFFAERSRMPWPFFAERSLTPDRVKPADVLGWVHGIGKSGRTPSSTTIGSRIACLSSYYRFLIRIGLVVSNPCDAVERPRTRREELWRIVVEQVVVNDREVEAIVGTPFDAAAVRENWRWYPQADSNR